MFSWFEFYGLKGRKSSCLQLCHVPPAPRPHLFAFGWISSVRESLSRGRFGDVLALLWLHVSPFTKRQSPPLNSTNSPQSSFQTSSRGFGSTEEEKEDTKLVFDPTVFPLQRVHLLGSTAELLHPRCLLCSNPVPRNQEPCCIHGLQEPTWRVCLLNRKGVKLIIPNK